jgi:hypothetical protein
VHAMRAYRSRGIALLHSMKVSGECHATASLPWVGVGCVCVRGQCYPLNRRFGGTQSRAQGYREEKKKSLSSLPGIRPWTARSIA